MIAETAIQLKDLGHWHRGCRLEVRERKVAVLTGFLKSVFFFLFGFFRTYSFYNNKDGGRDRPTIMDTPTLRSLVSKVFSLSLEVRAILNHLMCVPSSVTQSLTVLKSLGVNTKFAKASVWGKKETQCSKKQLL